MGMAPLIELQIEAWKIKPMHICIVICCFNHNAFELNQKMCKNCHGADIIIFSLGDVFYNVYCSKSKVHKSGFNKNKFSIQSIFESK
jgi:hypothetical protein